MPSSVINPQLNETLAPYQFDAGVTISGSNLSGGTASLAPAQYGLKGWSFPVILASGTSAAITTGSVYLSQVTLPVNTTLANIYYYQVGSATALSTTASFAGVYFVNSSSTAALVASTAALTTTNFSTAAATFKALPLTAQYTTAATGTYYLALLIGATTGPTMGAPASIPPSTLLTGPVNAAAAYPFAINGTGASTLPATLTLSSNTAAVALWAGCA